MLNDRTRVDWLKGWSEAAFEVGTGIVDREQALEYLVRTTRQRRVWHAREFGYIAGLSTALGVI